MKRTPDLTPTARRPMRRRSERGQMVPIVALFAVVLLGCTAIATDLSVATHYKRNLQNISDAAALIGAKQLPAKVQSTDQATAAIWALRIIHNALPWNVSGSWSSTIVNNAGCGGLTLQCSVTICAGLNDPACTAGWQTVTPSSGEPFNLTVNTPPKQSALYSNSSDSHYLQRVEVVLHQKSGGYFSGIFGVGSNTAGSLSVAYHFAPNQPFPFALFSNTVIGDGNSPELIAGNVYANRYLSPQANGHAAVCAEADQYGNAGYIVLGAPQYGDSGYANDGQFNDNSNVQANAATIQDGPTITPNCSNIQTGQVGMSGAPGNCASTFSGIVASGNIGVDSNGDACEAKPALTIPEVVSPPDIPNYYSGGTPRTQCAAPPPSVLDPTLGIFQCPGGSANSLVINSSVSTMKPGIYEILPAAKTKGCDVLMDGTFTNLAGVTFYLMQGASMCVNPLDSTVAPNPNPIVQTPACVTSGCPNNPLPGDGVYAVLSDNSLNPTITMNTSGSGSFAGVWQVQGTIWLPTGTVNISNKDALQDAGQILVDTWNDTSGDHQNPSVTYNRSNSSPQKEVLQLVQ